ncbi:holin [Senimuribacter intestinalis]|uniref:holin n=1 Tax=Senimuribacter intestinalis TaxID=2941507 RepID=UPI0027D968B4|nr:holin [Senimuribacter intestinalis]
MSKKWLKAAAVRAVKTMAQAAIAMIGTSVVMTDVSWQVTVSAAILAGILSMLTSVAGLPEVDEK